MIFMLTSVFTVSRLQRQNKLKNDTKFVNLFKLKAIVNQSLKELFPLALFCSLVLIYVGYNSEQKEVDEGKQKPHSGISRIKQSLNSRILKKNSNV